jgi:hypothetical protein
MACDHHEEECMELPYVPPPPQNVRVTNWPTPELDAAKDFFYTLQRRYYRFVEVATDDQQPVMLGYTPSGEEVRIAEVSRFRGYGAMLLMGEDESGNPCDVIVQPHSAQVVLKLITPTEDQERRPVGFKTLPAPDESAGG